MRKLYLFLIELLFAALLVYPYFWPVESGWLVFPVLLVFAVFFSIYIWLLGRLRKTAKIIFLALLLPALISIGMVLGFHPVPVAAAIAFLFWRGNSLSGGKAEDQDLLIASFSAMAAFPAMIGAHLKNETIFQITILLVIAQVAVVLSGRFLLNLSKIEGNRSEKAGYMAFYAKLIGPIVLAGSLIALAMNYLQSAFFLILKGIAIIFATIATPILMWSETLNLWTNPDQVQIEVVERPGVGKVIREEATQKYTEIALMALAVLAIIGLFIYLYKKRTRIYLDEPTRNFSGQTLILDASKGKAKRRKPNPPENMLRREIFSLEYFARKNGFGRFESETVGEWWNRIEIPSNQSLVGLYEAVRYGNFQVGLSDLELARRELKGIKELIKQRGKEQKKRKAQMKKAGF
ncbi:hypothetical protein [Bacillus sp. FJAT-27445]|uniref:hypothetical protein n=1 Tax=Bacillus sp. FJAT-27445 TaxID=1679166 RepID=UPI000AF7795F|nr:hypothetical protein [Bacillus sp. FJAT-27445]